MLNYPFPGMDPYLEHPVLWESVHARLIPAIANQLQPQLDPRYIASIEERVFVEGSQRRIPDVWVQELGNQSQGTPPAGSTREVQSDTAIIVEVEELEVRQKRVQIFDAYNAMKLVAIIEHVSPTNKRLGEGKVSYQENSGKSWIGIAI